MTCARRARGDDGVALVMALIFLVIVALFITVALEKAQSTSLVGQQIRVRSQLQYTLDGGVDRGLQLLKGELSTGSPGTCTSPTDDDGQGTFDLNDQSARYTCRTIAGRAALSGDAGLTNFALLVTDPADGALTTQSGAGTNLQVAGSVYLQGKITNGDIGKPIDITDGDLVSPQSAACQSNLDAVSRISLTGSGQLRTCTQQTLAQSLPAVALPSAPTVDLSPTLGAGVLFTASGGRKCTVFYPGLYTSAPVFGNDSKNYFVSGLYYFRNVGAWEVDDANVEVMAGQRALATDTSTPTNDCSSMSMNDARATNPTAVVNAAAVALSAAIAPYRFAYGATWAFGGSSKLNVKKGAFTLFSPPLNGSPIPISLVGASSYTDASYVSQVQGAPTITGGGNNSSMQLNGKLFAPKNYVEVFSTNNTVAAAKGGVVAFRILLKASASGTNALVISASNVAGTPPPPFRTVLIETTDNSGASSARNRAVAKLSNFSPFTVTVLSWRTE